MSKVSGRTPTKSDSKDSDHKRDNRGDRGDKSHGHGRSDSRNKHSNHSKDTTDDSTQNAEVKSGEEKKFTGRCRLFVGNLTQDVSEDDFRKMFQQYGEVSEVYVNSGRGFGFVRLDYRQNAEAAKAALDGLQRKGRALRVRFATHGAALKVKNLHPFVSNELLEQAFTQFGDLERAVVVVDERGKPTGEGLVEFVRKPGAQQALRRITEGVFLFGADPKPIEVEPLEQKDEEDGLPEKLLPRNEQYKKEREKDPHFAAHGSFEYEFGMRWKQLADMEKKRIENVKKEMEEARIKLEDEMQNAIYEYQAEQIRQDLLRQQEELRRIEELRNQDRMRRQQELEMRTMSRRAEEERERQIEERRRQEMMMRQQEMQRRSGGPMDSGMHRSREEMMAMEGGFQGSPGGMGMRGGQGQGDQQMRGGRGGAPPMQPPPVPPGMSLERGGPQGMGMERGGQQRERGGQPDMGMERGGQPGMGMERGGQQGMGMERGGQQGMGMERGGQPGMGMDRGGQPGMQMERGGQQSMGMERGGQPGMGMDRGGQQGMNRMQQGGGGQGNFGQGGNAAGNPNNTGSPNVNMGGQGGPGNQMDTDSVTNHFNDAPGVSLGTAHSVSRQTPSQFEDADEDRAAQELAYDNGSWLPPPDDRQQSGIGEMTTEHEPYYDKAQYEAYCDAPEHETYSNTGHEAYSEPDPETYGKQGHEVYYDEPEREPYCDKTEHEQYSDKPDEEACHDNPETQSQGNWEWGKAGSFSHRDNGYSDTNAEHVDWYGSELDEVENGVALEGNSVQAEMAGQEGECEPTSHRQHMEVQEFGEEPHTSNSHNSEQETVLDGQFQDPVVHESSEQSTGEGQDVTEANSEEPDYSMALVPYVPPPDSPVSSISTSPSTSPRPFPQARQGPNVAASATGIPLHQNPLAAGQPGFVRIHPMHIAAAVAAQRCRAAAVMQQQTRMAAAAAMHQQAAAAATAQHQAAAAAAAAQQRTRAALMHQQLVRSRYMGAPVLVRQPFVPVARAAAPMRVRVRLRRSVMLTEELNLDQP